VHEVQLTAPAPAAPPGRVLGLTLQRRQGLGVEVLRVERSSVAERAGLVISILVVALVSAAGSEKFRLDWKALALLLGFVAFCVAVFVKGLGVPLPVLGTWFGG